MPENTLAIIGDEDAVSGFRALGFKDYPLKDAKEFKAILEKIVESNLAVCLLQDNIYIQVQEEINNYRGLTLPIFIPFSKTAKTDLLESVVRAIRLRATGAF